MKPLENKLEKKNGGVLFLTCKFSVNFIKIMVSLLQGKQFGEKTKINCISCLHNSNLFSHQIQPDLSWTK